ncbi:MarR family transcriptional regulator [Nocardioides gansuensis]|uniref:MarR family transcriptional regulator n=1 Tax=Nocardioides gansuensis TaxID=2138300 RepID=A0A2T8FFQ2_9ACTN|nr:MarR family transcriptional regulator [Nocardioides gansuensis]PVG84525.1 MarR family transcriptional regulator [Nocardioides gansuensis]
MTETRQQAAAELGRALQRYQRSVQAFDDRVGRSLGLNPADLRCLDWLTEGPLSAGQLSQATGLRPAATTALIDRLVAKGYVRRVPAAGDRRRVLVEMTEEGAARTWACYGPMVQEGEGLLSGFTRAELARMRDLLIAMIELTDRHAERLVTES